MNPTAYDLNALLTLDFDDVVEGARSMSGKSRNNALQNALVALQSEPDLARRAKLLLFFQTILASTPDAELAPALVEPIANELIKVLLTQSEPDAVKRSALDVVALLLLKASDRSSDTGARLCEAIAGVANSSDPEVRGFAQRLLHQQTRPRRRSKPKILLIYGQDETNRLRLENFIRDRLHASAVVLNELPASGQTIIEKFEQEVRGADFAVVLWTPEDMGNVRSSVAFELGWVYASLGASRVLLLVQEGVPLPSDLEGINRIDFAENVLDVSSRLLTELESANLPSQIQETA